MNYMSYKRTLITENKWRASRYGIEGSLIDFGKEAQVPLPDLIAEFVDLVDDVLDELDSREEVENVFNLLKKGTGADRQLKVYEETGDMKKVVDYIIDQTGCGLG